MDNPKGSLLGNSEKEAMKMGTQAVPDLCHKMADTSLLFEMKKTKNKQ